MARSGDDDIEVPVSTFDVEDAPMDGIDSGTKLMSPYRVHGRAVTPTRTKSLSSKREAKVLRIFIAILSVLFMVVVIVLLATNTGKSVSRDASAAAHTGAVYDTGFNMKQNWGSYSPYFSSGSTFDKVPKTALDGEYTLPDTCRLRQVHVLHRHGDRYPAEGTATRMEKVAKKLKNMKEPPALESLSWILDWKYRLRTDLLVGAGVGALFDSGAKFWGSHGRLLYGEKAEDLPAWSDKINVRPDGTPRPKPVLRATDQDRIQDSARAWAAGFFGTYGSPSSGVDPLDHYKLILMAEAEHQNNSLAGYFSCPNADKKDATNGNQRSKIWVEEYLAHAVTRIQKALPGYDSLSAEEVLALQDMCVFETAAFGASAFCNLFTEQEWRGFEYHTDLKFYGDSAWGSTVAPATGLPWLAELKSRLTQHRITSPEYGVNTTLSSDEKLFPLDQPFYADFTHDSVIVSVLSALQFPFTKEDLPSTKIKVPRQFIVSRLTPFAARLYIEVLDCGSGGNAGSHVRMKLNDRVLPIWELKHCDDDDDGKLGLCPLRDFVRSLDWALQSGDFEDICYSNRTYKPFSSD